MLTAIVLIFIGLTVSVDWFPGIKTKPVRESVVYGAVTAAALALLLLYSIGAYVNGPSEAISSMVKAIFPVK